MTAPDEYLDNPPRHPQPADNPKHAAGRAKASVRCIPPAAILLEGAVMESGAEKYGAFNWGEAGVVASVYSDAIIRHLLAWYSGEDTDPESGKPHLAHIRACCGILIDCQMTGLLEDDRPVGKTMSAAQVIEAINRNKAITRKGESNEQG